MLPVSCTDHGGRLCEPSAGGVTAALFVMGGGGVCRARSVLGLVFHCDCCSVVAAKGGVDLAASSAVSLELDWGCVGEEHNEG